VTDPVHPGPVAAFKDYGPMIARLKLAKVPLCLIIGCATLFGAILADPVISWNTLLAVGGVFLVATGAASLNSLQEHRLDAKLERTKDRPLPIGQLTLSQAGCQAVFLLLCGLLLLAKTADTLPVLMTASAVILYNGIYTPMKAISILAIIPGAICGALPAYIGWLAGGGEGFGFTPVLLFALFILWQIPHFWLILLNYQEDYAGGRLPNLLSQFQENTLKRLFITWIGALAFIMLMFAALPQPIANIARSGVIINGLCLSGMFFLWLKVFKSNDYRLLFIALNCALVMHMVILAVGRIVGN
jgi:heme o synthase